jgi:hypothetical protein
MQVPNGKIRKIVIMFKQSRIHELMTSRISIFVEPLITGMYISMSMHDATPCICMHTQTRDAKALGQ